LNYIANSSLYSAHQISLNKRFPSWLHSQDSCPDARAVATFPFAGSTSTEAEHLPETHRALTRQGYSQLHRPGAAFNSKCC